MQQQAFVRDGLCTVDGDGVGQDVGVISSLRQGPSISLPDSGCFGSCLEPYSLDTTLFLVCFSNTSILIPRLLVLHVGSSNAFLI